MPKRNLIIIAGIVAAAVVIIWLTRDRKSSAVSDGELSGVAGASQTIRDNFYRPGGQPGTSTAPSGPISEEDLRRWMVHGMVTGLKDEYSRYVPPEDAAAFEAILSGKYGSPGIVVEVVDEQVQVVGCVLHSPAHRQGILPGDVLLAIDGKPLAGRKLSDVKRMLDGPIGSSFSLILRREEKVTTQTLTRKEMSAESVQGLHRDSAGQWLYSLPAPYEKIAYIRVKEFLGETPERVQAALRSAAPFDGLILDLRDNPGGQFEAARLVADMFMPKGVICTVFGRNGTSKKYSAQPKANFTSHPIVVLVNGRSASGSEIVAGALAVNDCAAIVGTRTRGKGCMQQPFKLEHDLGQINLTTSEFYVGEDHPIARLPGSDTWGVDPDMEVTIKPQSLVDELARIRLELELAPRPRTAATDSTTPASDRPYSQELLQKDNQLSEAISLLQSPAKYNEVLAGAQQERSTSKSAPASSPAAAASASEP